MKILKIDLYDVITSVLHYIIFKDDSELLQEIREP